MVSDVIYKFVEVHKIVKQKLGRYQQFQNKEHKSGAAIEVAAANGGDIVGEDGVKNKQGREENFIYVISFWFLSDPDT